MEHPESHAVVISVQGEAFAEMPAERATVALSVGFEGPDRTEVRDLSTRAHAACVESITVLHDAVDGPIVEWTSDDVQVWSERPWNGDGTLSPLIHHSRTAVTATFIDFIRLGLWIDETAASDGVTIGGISWTVTDLSRRELESRAQRDAVAHAIDKASIYASSLGLGPVTPLKLSEPPTVSPLPGLQEDARMFATTGGASVGFAPAPVRSEIRVHVKFSADRATRPG